MGEIKSTLDIVMEKTKHLTLSEEEKKTRDLAEVRSSVKGLVQKYEDMILDKAQLEEEIRRLQADRGMDTNPILLDDIFERLDLGGDNGPLLELLGDLLGLDTQKLSTLFADYRDAVQTQIQAGMAEKKSTLSEKYGVSGSAVVPNLAADAEWQQRVLEIQEKYDKILAGEKRSLSESL